jgi:type I restriction enzyme S subunit
MRARPSAVAEIEIPVAPLSEQRRIVAKINSLSATSKRARDQLDHIPRLIEKYKRSILAAAFRSELGGGTARMLPSSRLKDLCISITDGDHQAPPKAASGVPFITIAAMNDGVIKLDQHDLCPSRMRILSSRVSGLPLMTFYIR